MVFGLVALLCIILGVAFFALYQKKKKEEEEKKGFIVIAGTLLFIYLFPSVALIVIGIVCLLLFLGAVF